MKGRVLIRGISGSPGIGHGSVRVIKCEPGDEKTVNKGDIIVCDAWGYFDGGIESLKNAAALVQNRGGRTAIGLAVIRELGIPAVVGTVRVSETNATEVLRDGMQVVVEGETGEMGLTKEDGTKTKVKYGTVYEYLPE